MSPLSRSIFLKQDPRKIGELFDLLISEQLSSEDIYEQTANIIKEKEFEKSLIITGFPKGGTYETDGPIGAFVIADLLKNDLKIPNVTIVVPQGLLEKIHLLCRSILPNIDLRSIEEIGVNHLETTLAVSIEFPGPNIKGIFHHMDGNQLVKSFLRKKSPFQYLKQFWLGMEEQNSNSLTIGIGDGGNELGLGRFEQQIQQVIPFGERCACSCKAGIASSIPSSITLLGNTSNWAAFALASALDYSFSYETYRKWLSELNSFGIVDGVTGEIAPTVDGIDPLIDQGVIFKLFS